MIAISKPLNLVPVWSSYYSTSDLFFKLKDVGDKSISTGLV